MEPDTTAKVRAGGALVFPPVPGLPFSPYRGTLYTPDELFTGLLDAGYDATPDARAYRWYQETKAVGDMVAGILRSIHDDAVSGALDDHLAGARVVGTLDGHAMERGSAAYAGAARLGRRLSRVGLTVTTCGGPGAMEGANLGAAPIRGRRARQSHWNSSPRRHTSGPRSLPGPVPPSKRSGPGLAADSPSPGPRGSTVTSRLTPSRRISRSASSTRCAKKICWPGPTPAWCSFPVRRGPCRRSSTPRRSTSTGRAASRPPWCW